MEFATNSTIRNQSQVKWPARRKISVQSCLYVSQLVIRILILAILVPRMIEYIQG
jgi:hypothetical protein